MHASVNIMTLWKFRIESIIDNQSFKTFKMKRNHTDTKTKWAIDQSHSEISFKVRHLMIAHVKGTFKTFDASIYTYAKDFRTAEIDLWIDASSIQTGDVKRDEHLKSSDFFDVINHKQITFTSSTIGPANSDGNHELWGKLTMVGITQNVKLNVQFGGMLNDPWGNERVGFAVSTIINRSDWGLTWNTTTEAGGVMVSDEIAISCEVELTRIGQKSLNMKVEQTDEIRS
jgi:polyisoprenoid-binding protein YceI